MAAIDVGGAEGFRNLEAALQRLKDNADEAAHDAVVAMGAVAERAIKMELSRSSHPPGVKTQSSPGSPPSLVTGRLRASVRQTRLYHSGPGQWTANIAPTTVYARIQELGGDAGKDHRSHLPPRPYVAPAQLRFALQIRDAAISAFKKVSGLPG